jgi:hypothetical protein
MSKQIRSAVVIAQLLGVEGFSDFTANQVEKYWKERSGLSDRQRRQIAKLEKELSRVMADLSEGDRLIVGKFIGLHKKMSFDTGLRLGLQAFIHRNGEPILENGNGQVDNSLRQIHDALKDAINQHGPISQENVVSAAKRIRGLLKKQSA